MARSRALAVSEELVDEVEYEPSEGSSGAAEDTPEGTPRGTTTQLHSNKLSSGDDASDEDAPDIDS